MAVADTKIEASDKYTVLTPRGVKNISSLKVVKRLQEFYYSYVTAGFGLDVLYVLHCLSAELIWTDQAPIG